MTNCIVLGIRNNLLYPALFMLCINLLRIIKVASFPEIAKKDNNITITFFSALTFLSNIIFSIIFLYLKNKSNKKKKNSKIVGIYVVQEGNSEHLKRLDSDSKIFFLIFLDAYLEFIGTIRHIYLLKVMPTETKLIPLDIRIRSREIIFASIICHFTIGAQLKRHHIVSLIIIVIFLISLYIYEVYLQHKLDYYNSIFKFLELQALKVLINICRVFADVIEKYLFEFNYLLPLKLLFIKGVMQAFFMAVFYLFNLNYAKEGFSNLFSNNDNNFSGNDILYIIFIIIALLLYFIVSGFSYIYKLFTIKMYSPMTRTLSDTILDIFYFIYFSTKENDKKQLNSKYFWHNLISIIIMIFFNLVYNEFLVLNFWGMGKNTYSQISKRATNIELINDNKSDYSDSNASEDLDISTL